MLVGVELLVVQLYGDEPNDNCDDLQIHQDPCEALLLYAGLQAQQRLHAHIQTYTHCWSGAYWGVDKEEAPGLW